MKRLPIHIDGLIYAKQAHGGISRNFTNLINAFVERSDTDVNLYLDRGVEFPSGMASVHTREIPGQVHLRPSRLFRGISDTWSNRRRRNKWASAKSGVFHSSFYSSPEGLSIPQILSMHDTIFEDYPTLFNTDRHRQHLADKKHAFDNCSAVVFPSEFARSRASTHYDLSGKRTRTIPHALDAQFREIPSDQAIAEFRMRATGGRPFLLHVGSRYLHKNVARLIEAYAQWGQRDEIALLLAGGGPLDAEEDRLIAALGVENRVQVIPRLSDTDLVCAYHAALAFVFPSLSEGFGFPILEALACACPTACANAASLPEVGGEAPVYFDPLRIESIVAALDEVVASSGDNDRWNAARARTLRRTWSDVACEFAELYSATS